MSTQNTLYKLANSSNRNVCPPDIPFQNQDSSTRPSPNFVLCRDEKENPTAIYGQDRWDFNPYRLSARKIALLRFDKIFPGANPTQTAIIEDVKFLLYCFIYYGAGQGRIGKLSAGTIKLYFYVLSDMARFCYNQVSNPLVGPLTFQQLLTSQIYLGAFAKQQADRNNFNGLFPAMMGNLASVGEKILGYRVLTANDVGHKKERLTQQHPVIPTRIYLEIINRSAALLDKLESHIERLSDFILALKDDSYGLSVVSQQRLKVPSKDLRPTFSEAVVIHQLDSFFEGDFICSSRKSLPRAIASIQYVVKSVLHLYSGMRDQEVMRLKYNCVRYENITEDVLDNSGRTRDHAQTISIISTTTKFEGYKLESTWFATTEALRAVKIAQKLCEAISVFYDEKNIEDRPLFLNPSALYYRAESNVLFSDTVDINKARALAGWLENIVVTPADLVELSHTDPNRDFGSDPRFMIGRPWPITSHQYRRSLAFYASNSGFVSLPSLKAQFKHLTLEMARYYSNNFNKLRTIFGYFDHEKQEFVLPSTHIALEFQMGIPIGVANQLLSDLLFHEQPLFGGTGSYAQKQKSRIESGEIIFDELRHDTEKRARNGEISYKSTLLGACTKVGPCDDFLLGNFTKCLSCLDGIIHPAKINSAIIAMSSELREYDQDSGEYQIVKSDIEQLESFQERYKTDKAT